MWLLIAGILVLVAVAIGIGLYLKKKPVEKILLEKFQSSFLVYNYLPNHRVTVSVTKPVQKVLVENIPPKKTGQISTEDVINYLKNGYTLTIEISSSDDPKSLIKFADYVIDMTAYYAASNDFALDDNLRIKALHVGMITSRAIEPDNPEDDRLIGNAYYSSGLGRPWVYIHNATSIPLHFNNNIELKPHTYTRYKGRYHYGVPLGTIFKNGEGIFSDFQYTVPTTDIYFGVVSDIAQPLDGEIQYGEVGGLGQYSGSKAFNDAPTNLNPSWILQLGHM